MKNILLTIAAALLVGCGESQQSEAKPVEPVAEVPARPSAPPVEAKPVEPVAEESRTRQPKKLSEIDYDLLTAAKNGNINDVKSSLAAGANINAIAWRFDRGRTPLNQAVTYKHTNVVEYLINIGADINQLDKYGESPVGMAIRYKDYTVTKMLIDAGANVNISEKNGKKPIHFSVDMELMEITKLLIATGVNVNTKTKKSIGALTALHLACKKGSIKFSKLLIEAGADIEQKNSKLIGSWAPIHEASYRNHKLIVELLISKGANVNIQSSGFSNNFGQQPILTPLDVAKRFPEIADLLRKHGGKTGEELKAEEK